MTKVILQVPMSKITRDGAVAVAKEQGFSSLQEVVRLFLEKFRGQQYEVAFIEKPVQLSAKNEKRYRKTA